MERKNSREKIPAELYEGVVTLRDNLREPYTPSWCRAQEQADGVIAVGYPTYPDWLWSGIWDGIYLIEFFGADYFTYYDEFDFIEDPDEVKQFTLDKLYTWFVVFGNRERMSEGLIGNGAEQGTVFLIADRLIELLNSDRSAMSAIGTSNWTKKRAEGW
ncbi:hypothetical protein [Corynebacterium capitovis]|uniref:hypothetical protein n=1 Tax=Corynebacterium capitovis TaxID=131081 RepID=UPI00036D5856|nr:hypothetical protein [Corynebacterium capitovis]